MIESESERGKYLWVKTQESLECGRWASCGHILLGKGRWVSSLTDGITIGPLSGCGLKRRYVPGRPKDGKWGKVGGQKGEYFFLGHIDRPSGSI